MRLVEELNVLRYYKPFIEAGGGVKQVRTALRWSEWYAVKWWEEVYSELGLQSIRESVFARALFISLRIRGYVREDGSIKKRPEKPEYPTNSCAMEFVDLHESFDRIGAVNVAANKADENTLAVLYSTMLSQGWYKILRQTFLRLMEIERYPAVFEPVVKEGHTAAAVMEITTPKMYIGFDSQERQRRVGLGDVADKAWRMWRQDLHLPSAHRLRRRKDSQAVRAQRRRCGTFTTYALLATRPIKIRRVIN
jgi:hypothetical protein